MAKKGEYTLDVAANAVCGFTRNGNPRQDLPARLRTRELVPVWKAFFKENLHFDRDRYQVELGGYQWRNPFNQDDGTLAAFPKIAYYRVWREKPGGMNCPPWFTDLYDADFEETTGNDLPPGKHAPDDFLEKLNFWTSPPYQWDFDRLTQFKDESEAAAFFRKVLARVERKQKAAANEAPDSDKGEAADLARSTPAPASGPATGRGPESEAAPAEVICDGLTVEAVRGVLADYPALADVIAAAAEVRGFPDGRDKGAATIVANINRRIRKRSNASGELWGRAPDKSGALSGGQSSALVSLFEPWSNGGRPTKQSAAKKAGGEKPSS